MITISSAPPEATNPYLHRPHDNHINMLDDRKIHFSGIIGFPRDANTGRFQ